MAWLRLVLVLGILTAGCGHMSYQRFDKQMWANYIHANELQKGMSKAEVTGIMGPPAIRESGDYRGGHYTVYFYLTHSMDFADSNTVRGGYTPLVFKNDRLAGIGKRDYRAMAYGLQSESEAMPKESLPWGRTH
jgi:outer membrane protein assembly factor BamE (lipoprotein component of BamABCDE complex)